MPPTLPSAKPWHHHLTLDLLLYVFSRSIFHPAITLIFYLCIAAMHKHREPIAYYTLYWAGILMFFETLSWVNHRVTYGLPRKVDWSNEVVVVTGGASGLGRVVVQMLLLKGVKVAVVDVKGVDPEAEEFVEGVRGELCWCKADVGVEGEVKQAAERIREELGSPTILINNAALPIHGVSILPSSTRSTLSPAQALKTLKTNTLSHFIVLDAFLPSLLDSSSGGHIITVSSILSHLSPANLADYTASKAAISSLHNTLAHEIRNHSDPQVQRQLKTTLFEIGQMDTNLFAEMQLPWYANFFGPMLETKDVAKHIVRVLETGEGGVIRMPAYAVVVGSLYSALPGMAKLAVRWFSGIDSAVRGKEGKAGKVGKNS